MKNLPQIKKKSCRLKINENTVLEKYVFKTYSILKLYQLNLNKTYLGHSEFTKTKVKKSFGIDLAFQNINSYPEYPNCVATVF